MSGSHKNATNTKKSEKEKSKDRPIRKRNGNVKTDLASKGRERQDNPKAKESIKQKFENCQVCGKSFKKGRGLNIHMSNTSCRGILERRSRICKSRISSPQETHHSGSTRRNNRPRHCSPSAQGKTKTMENEKHQEAPDQIKNLPHIVQENATNDTRAREEENERIRQEDVLVVDDEVEKAIRKKVLTLPQCIEEKLQCFRNKNEGGMEQKNEEIVVLRNPAERSKKSILHKKEQKKHIQGFKCKDIRQFVTYEPGSAFRENKQKQIKRVVVKKEVAAEHSDKRQVVKVQELQRYVESNARLSTEDRVRSVVFKEPIDHQDEVTPTDHEVADSGTDERHILQITKAEENKTAQREVIVIDTTDERQVIETSNVERTGIDEVNAIIVQDEIADGRIDERQIIKIHDVEEIFKENQQENSRVIVTKRTEEDLKAVAENLNTGQPEDIISNHYLEMRRKDYRTLTGRNLLNDKVIDEYLHLIQDRSRRPNIPSVYAMPIHSYTWLDADFSLNATKVESWIKEDLERKDIVLVPIHKEDHYSLVVFDTKKSLITYHDSIIGTRRTSNAPRVMKRFFTQLWEKKGKPLNIIKTKIDETAPLQNNGYDCGVFVCENAEMISRGVTTKPKQDCMPQARKRIMKEIYLGRLITERNPSIFDMAKQTRSKKVNKKEQKMPRKEESKGQNFSRKHVKETSKGENRTLGKERINFPKSNSPEWERLDQDLSSLLRTLYAPAVNRAKTHPNVIYGMCRERFGLRERSQKRDVKSGPSRRQIKCKHLREEITLLKRAYAEAPQEEKDGIQELQSEKLKKLRLAKRAESLRKNRKKFSNNCKSFLNQPYQFARNILSPKPKGDMESPKEEVEKFLKDAHADPRKEEALGKGVDLLVYQTTEKDFDDKAPTYNEFAKKLRRTRSKSAPGPNGVPYLLYKRCPRVSKLLWGYLKELWIKNTISDTWREAEGVFIPKEDGAKSVEKFRTISLLNVEGKIFFSLKADRITDFLVKNKYINASIQKGGIPNVSGCIEHTAILSQLIREAKKEKKNLVVTWLDIANAYGSIPHAVIRAALEAAHVPKKTQDLISSYYNDVKIRFSTKKFTTEWQKVEKGIITGCTLSVILFALSMSWLVESVRDVTKGPLSSSGQRQVNSRLFMDDITTTTETVPQTKCLLQKLSDKFIWAGMKVRAEKCRSLVIVKGKVQKRELRINGEVITSILDKPVKYLGKEYKANLNEKEQTQEVLTNLKTEIRKIDRCRLPGRYKSWILQHMLMPRLMWPLTIYNIPLTKVEWLQRTITASLKKWLGIPKSFSTDCMYSKTSKVVLPFSSLIDDFKAAKARNMVTFQESEDPCIKGAGIVVDAGRKANTEAEIQEAKSRLKTQEIIGITNTGKEGLGMNKGKYYSKSSAKEQRSMIVNTVREKEEERRVVKMTQLVKQGQNLRWEVPQRRIKSSELNRMSDDNFKFLIKSVHDLLPTPANKNKWFGTAEMCNLCGENATLNHILSGCRVALGQGRYKWRHDKVLKEVAASIEVKISENAKKQEVEKRRIQFVKAGEKCDKQTLQQESYLSTAKDWKLSVDLKGGLRIPLGVCSTNLRPDIIIVSSKTKQMGIVELTVPMEDRIEISGELKRSKYEKIVTEGRQNGWKVRCWSVEVGCRGFPATSMSAFFKDIGYHGGQRKKVVEKVGSIAENASKSLWKASHYKEFFR